MKEYSTKDIRDIVLIGSSKSGKTTLSEAMLFEGKVVDRRGTVEGKNTVSDNTEFEQTNQKSVYATPLYAEFMNTKFNIIDAPGSDDFCGGAISAFKVCESAILTVNAQQGVEVGTEIFARYADQYNKPMIVAVNQLDTEKANWDHTRDTLKEAFGKKVVFAQFPVNPGLGFDGIVDVITMKYYHFTDDNGKFEESDIPAQYADEAEEMRMELVEKAAEGDDALMEKYFETMELSIDEIRAGLSAGMAAREVMPVFCLSARKDLGVKRLMEFVVNVAPSPVGEVNKTIGDMALRQLSKSLLPHFKEGQQNILNLLSTDAANGKSYLAQELQNYWISIGLHVRLLTYDEDFLAEDSKYIMAHDIKDLCPDLMTNEIAIVEYPNLDDNSISPALLNTGTINLLVTRANRTWKDVDQKALKELHAQLNNKDSLYMYLTEAQRYAVEEFVGQLPPYTRFNNFVYRISQMGLTAVENSHAK